jgi:hypothetical protein
MKTQIENRIVASIPDGLAAALEREALYWRYSSLCHIFHCICIETNWWIGVAGDGDNGCYEWFVAWFDGQWHCKTSDCGYGMTTVALRDVISENVS